MGIKPDDTDLLKLNPVNKELDKVLKEISETPENKELLSMLSRVRNRDIIRETIMEYERRGEFVRILPARGGEHYEQYF